MKCLPNHDLYRCSFHSFSVSLCIGFLGSFCFHYHHRNNNNNNSGPRHEHADCVRIRQITSSALELEPRHLINILSKNTYQIRFYLYHLLCNGNDTFYWQYIWSFCTKIKTNISHNAISGKLKIAIDVMRIKRAKEEKKLE